MKHLTGRVSGSCGSWEVQAALTLNLATSGTSTPSISSFIGSFMLPERLTKIVQAVRLMNKSRKASYISTSECRLKFYLDYSQLLNVLAAVTVRILNQMYLERGLGRYPKKYGLGVLQICMSSTLRFFYSTFTIRFDPGYLYFTSISTEMGDIFFTFSRQVYNPSGQLFFSFFTSFFKASHSIDPPITSWFTKQKVLLSPFIISKLHWKIWMGTFLRASLMYMWSVLVKRYDGNVSFIYGSQMETQGKSVFSRKTLNRYLRYHMSLQDRYSARQQSPSRTGTKQNANFWYSPGGTSVRKSPILFRTVENSSSLPRKTYYRKLEQKNQLYGYCLMI